MPGTLVDAIRIAVEKHGQTLDKAGQPYILHPLRVMMAQTTEHGKIVGVLHDTVEDTDLSFEELEQQGFPAEVLTALRLVTHDDGSPYHEYIERLKHNPIARRVKLADLHDNMDPHRLPDFTDRDMKRYQKYKLAWATLQAVEHAAIYTPTEDHRGQE